MQDLNKYKTKRNLYLGLLWLSLIFSLATTLLLYFLNVDMTLVTTIGLILVILNIVFLFYAKSKISFYDMKYKYFLLLSKSVAPYKVKEIFSNQFIDKLKKLDYQTFVNNDNFHVLYKITPTNNSGVLFKTSILNIVTLFKKVNLSYYDDNLENEYQKLYQTYQKKEKVNKQVIIQIKKYESFNEEIKNEIDAIISYKEKDNYLININCGYFSDKNTIYFLHSNDFYPNKYYKYGVENLKQLIK